MSDAKIMAEIVEQARNAAKEVFKLAHEANENQQQRQEAYRELVSRASAAYHYLDKALEAATDALKEETAKHAAPEKCPTSCDDDFDVDCHEEHQVPAKRHHKPEDCPSRTRAKEPAGAHP